MRKIRTILARPILVLKFSACLQLVGELKKWLFGQRESTSCLKKQSNFSTSKVISPMNTLQSLTGKNRGLQGNPCNENRDPAMRTGVPCNENKFFPVRIDLQGVPCKTYRVCRVPCLLIWPWPRPKLHN